MKGDVHAHVDTEPKPQSHSFCARTSMGDMPEYVEGDVKMCPHGKIFRWLCADGGYDRWSQLDPFFEWKEWRAARAAVRSAEGKLMPPLPPPRTGGYPATRPVPSPAPRTIEDAMGEGQRIISVKRDERGNPSPVGPNALMVVLQDQNSLGNTRNRTFTVQVNSVPWETPADLQARLIKEAIRRLEVLTKDVKG